MIGNVKEALTRKFGPLPAWAWAGVALVAVIMYRRYKGQQGTGTPISPVGEIQDQTPAPDATVLQPGETYVPPGYGSPLTGGGDGGGNGTPGPPGPPGPPGTPAPRPKPPKKHPKPKAKPTHRHIPKPHIPKRTAKRSRASIRDKIRGKPKSVKQHKSPHPPRSRTKTSAMDKPQRGRAPMPQSPALRQRPAPPKTVSPGHQQVKPVSQHQPMQHHPPARHTPARRRR